MILARRFKSHQERQKQVEMDLYMQIFGLDRIIGNSCNDRLWTSDRCLGNPYCRNLAENLGPENCVLITWIYISTVDPLEVAFKIFIR